MVYYGTKFDYGRVAAGSLVGMRYGGVGFGRKQTYSTSGTSTQVMRKRKPGYGRRNSFHQRLLKEIPALHSTVADSTCNQSMTHNTIYEFSPTQQITTGTGNANRAGDEVQLLALKINGIVISPASTSYAQYRIITLWSDQETATGSAFVSAIGSGSFFLPTTGTSWGPTSIINPKACTVVDDRTVVINSLVAGQSEIQNLNYTVPVNCKFPYRQAGSIYGKSKNLYVVVVSAIQNGVSGTTVTGTILLSSDLIFKNI